MMNRKTAIANCKIASKSDLVTFDNEKELYYVALVTHRRFTIASPKMVWTGYERKIGTRIKFFHKSKNYFCEIVLKVLLIISFNE